MDKIKPLFTAAATAMGGRNGHTESSDGVVKADLDYRKAYTLQFVNKRVGIDLRSKH